MGSVLPLRGCVVIDSRVVRNFDLMDSLGSPAFTGALPLYKCIRAA